ncbi:hypothetical protein ACLB2K_030374 [Fragaria x ananassa]
MIETMIERHIEPDTITYNSLMDGYGLRGQMDEVKQVFDLMVQKGSMVDVRSCNTLINGYCKQKKVDEAYKVFKNMTSWELVPDTALELLRELEGKKLELNITTYNIIIKEDLLRAMEEKGISPDGWTSNLLVQGFINYDEAARAVELIKEMRKKGYSADASTMELRLSKDRVDPSLSQLLKN